MTSAFRSEIDPVVVGSDPRGTGAAVSGADDAVPWAAFATAASAEAFCRSWLAVQCSLVRDVHAALLLLRDAKDASFVPAAIWPDAMRDVTHLAAAAEKALGERRGVVVGLDSSDTSGVAAVLSAGFVHVAYPVEVEAVLHGAVVLELTQRPDAELKQVLRQLLWGAGWLESLMRRRQEEESGRKLERMTIALDIVAAAQTHRHLDPAAMAVVNELADRFQAERVSVGAEWRGRLRLRAISRTAWFERKSRLVDIIENAMEEAMDQEATLAYPPLPGASGKVTVAQRDLGTHAGAVSVLSAPLLCEGRPIGAITLERNRGQAFDVEAARVCEAVGALLGPVLDARLDRERWITGRFVDGAREFRDQLFGPRHPLVKIGTLLALAVVLVLALVDGRFRVNARTVLQGSVQRSMVAPFDGFVKEALVRAGDSVRQGQTLAILDDRDLQLERVKLDAEREQAARKHREALAKHDRPATRVLAAQLAQTEAQFALVEEKLARTQLVAPFDGIVVSGDLSQMLGAPVEQGKVLFELAPLDTYRVVLKVDERDISHVAVGQHGELALTGIAGTTLPFSVKTVTSVSTPQDGRNFFRVEAQLAEAPPRLRPGMEGVGKIEVGERRLIWIWTRALVDWARINLWAWLP